MFSVYYTLRALLSLSPLIEKPLRSRRDVEGKGEASVEAGDELQSMCYKLVIIASALRA